MLRRLIRWELSSFGLGVWLDVCILQKPCQPSQTKRKRGRLSPSPLNLPPKLEEGSRARRPNRIAAEGIEVRDESFHPLGAEGSYLGHHIPGVSRAEEPFLDPHLGGEEWNDGSGGSHDASHLAPVVKADLPSLGDPLAGQSLAFGARGALDVARHVGAALDGPLAEALVVEMGGQSAGLFIARLEREEMEQTALHVDRRTEPHRDRCLACHDESPLIEGGRCCEMGPYRAEHSAVLKIPLGASGPTK